MRVAVLGAGYAGLTVARRLERALPADVELVVVEARDHHLVQHELHRLVRRPGLADVLQVPLADALDRATHRRARVTGVDPDARVVHLADGRLTYDVAAVCLGARTDFHGLPGVEEHAIPLKRLAHARRIREAFLALRGSGDRSNGGGDADGTVDPGDAREDPTEAPARVVVGGAGLSGVQIAGELAALSAEAGVGAEVVLLEQRDAVAPAFPERFRTAVREELAARGVRVRTGAAVAGADAAAVELSGGERLAYSALVWTGGIRGPGALDGDRPVVRSDLRLADRTFVVGDAGRMVDADGEAVPATAQAAVRAGRTAADNVATLVDEERRDRRERRESTEPRRGAGSRRGEADGGAAGGDGFGPRLSQFRFDGAGWAVSVGAGAGAAPTLGPTVLRGRAASVAKASIGASYLRSVGAVRGAARVVREELGWPGAEER